jgi:hypothetical protein
VSCYRLVPTQVWHIQGYSFLILLYSGANMEKSSKSKKLFAEMFREVGTSKEWNITLNILELTPSASLYRL